MSYRIGISTGFYRVARAPELLGLAAKIAYGATAGVNFVQIDLETTTEFLEPNLEYQVKKVKDLGMTVGLHGEISQEVMAVESAEFRHWEQSHLRLCETLEWAAKLGFVYVNIHLSTRPQLLFEESRFRVFGYQYPVVGFDGSPLHEICDKSKSARHTAASQLRRISHMVFADSNARQELAKRITKEQDQEVASQMDKLKKSEGYKVASQAERREAETNTRNSVAYTYQQKFEKESEDEDFLYKAWKDSHYAKYILDNSEIGAYEIVAKYMEENGDPLYSAMKVESPEYSADPQAHAKWCTAVSMKYIEGHLLRKDHSANREHLGGLSIKEFCEKNKIYLLFETPETADGMEGLYRLFNPLHAYHMIKKLGSPYIKLCLDFEHMLAHKMEPDKIIAQMPADAGRYIQLFHLGRPVIGTPATTHAPIPLGSHAQEVIYKWLWMLRQKGFTDGWFLYERGGGQTTLEVIQQSVQALRAIAEELEKGTPPNDLPFSFYGVSEQNTALLAKQRVAIRDNMMAPITGLIAVPEETHTFLGRAAIEKGRAEEWKRGKYR